MCEFYYTHFNYSEPDNSSGNKPPGELSSGDPVIDAGLSLLPAHILHRLLSRMNLLISLLMVIYH